MNAPVVRRRLLRPVGGLALGGGAVALALGLFATPAAAGGNPDFEGILSAAPPTGFTSSPAAYSVAHGPVLVDFDTVVKNLTGQTQKVTLNFSAHHILTDNGLNVADGQPGQPGITFTGPEGTTQALLAGTQTATETWLAGQSQTVLHEFSMDSCGYFQLDIWAPVSHPAAGQSHRATLASGFIRVLGCDGGQGSSSPSPSPTGTVQATSSPSPTGGGAGAGSTTSSPTGQVLAATTPATGAAGSGGGIGLGLLLMVLGAVLLAIHRGLAIARSRRLPIDI